MLSVQSNTGPSWKDKTNKAFWRGRDSRQERLDLVVMGRKKPDMFDTALTNFFFFPYDEKKYGPKMKHISFFDFFKVCIYSLLHIQMIAVIECQSVTSSVSKLFHSDLEHEVPVEKNKLLPHQTSSICIQFKVAAHEAVRTCSQKSKIKP